MRWALDTLSWIAVALGFWGTWLAGRHRAGWLIGLACCIAWAVFDIALGIWAGLFAALVGCVLNVRNYRLGRDRIGLIMPHLAGVISASYVNGEWHLMVDGVEFPYMIADGPQVGPLSAHGYPLLTVSILADQIELVHSVVPPTPTPTPPTS